MEKHSRNQGQHLLGRFPLPHEVKRGTSTHQNTHKPVGNYFTVPYFHNNQQNSAFGNHGQGAFNNHHHHPNNLHQHQPPPLLTTTARDQVPNFFQESRIEAMMKEYMESQKQLVQGFHEKLDHMEKILDGKFVFLASQIQGIEERMKEVEEEQLKQAKNMEDNSTTIKCTNLTTKEMDNHLDEKIISVDENLTNTSEHLSTIAMIAHKTRRELREVGFQERQAYLAFQILMEAQKQAKSALDSLRFTSDGRFHDLLGKTMGLGEMTHKFPIN